jgi:iron complex transport system ATP-binding protein
VIFLKDGQIHADGPKSAMLTDNHISTLFDRYISLVEANGWYQVLPG